jgi:ferredoxin
MKLKVLEDVCIGCGACQAICDEVFEIKDDGIATVIVDEVPTDDVDNAVDAKEGCPVGAIVEITSEEE